MKPRVIVNCAMSADGKIALPTRKQTRISNEEDIRRVHNLRNSVDAILVGVGTVIADDPSLLVRPEYVSEVRNPVRIVLDSRCRSPEDAAVLDGKAQTIIVTGENCAKSLGGSETIRCGSGRVDLPRLMSLLHERGYQTLLVEGGGEVIWSFFREGLVDEFKIFIAPLVIGGRESPTPADGDGVSSLEDLFRLTLVSHTELGGGILLEYVVEE